MGSVFLSFALRCSLLLKMDYFLFNFAFIFLANGYIQGQNSRKVTPLKIPFYCQNRVTLPINTFFNAWEWHQFDFGIIFGLSCFLNWLFAAKFSNCSNSLNYEAKINCNTNKLNVPKCRKICIWLKFNLVHFNGPRTKF